MTTTDAAEEPPATQQQQQPRKWTDRERVLGLCSRGCLARTRHMLNDLLRLMPHLKHEAKFEKGQGLDQLNEMAELSNCTKCLYLENRKQRDLYLWLAEVAGGGPSVKFLVHNMHTMYELKFSGNCLKGSRPVLSFDAKFDSTPHLKLIKELLVGTFKTPNFHPKSQPFIDHVLNFAVTEDEHIWVRNYQIVDNSGKLEEIGPRMVWEVIRVFEGSFGGDTLYENPDYKTPNAVRRELKLAKAIEYTQRQEQKAESRVKDAFVRSVPGVDPVGSVFDTAEPASGDADGTETRKAKQPSKAGKTKHELELKILGKKRKASAKARKTKRAKKADDGGGDDGEEE